MFAGVDARDDRVHDARRDVTAFPVLKSQRDLIIQPSVGAQRLRWVSAQTNHQLQRSCIAVLRELIQLLQS